MKTKWGLRHDAPRRPNLELIKKSPQCLEYIIVHDVAFPGASSQRTFSQNNGSILPQWRLADELNVAPLRHELELVAVD
jgi:hypothetical protein